MHGIPLLSRTPRITSASDSASIVCEKYNGTMSRSCEVSTTPSAVLLLVIAFGILRHALRISQNVEGPAQQRSRGGLTMLDELREETESTDGIRTGSRGFLPARSIGVTVAMLYAPKSGKDARQYISR